MLSKPTAIIYVDGFNLYRRALDGKASVKWLDLFAMAQHLMPDFEVIHVHYFTALLRQGLLPDVRAASRQQIYLRALATMPDRLTVHFGKFQNSPRWMPKHPQVVEGGEFVKVQVRKLEEKGSYVHLAARMVADACMGEAEIFVLVSNGSDQVPTLRILNDEVGVNTGIIFPMPSAKAAKELVGTQPAFRTHVTDEALRASQLPSVLVDSTGEFHMPPSWA